MTTFYKTENNDVTPLPPLKKSRQQYIDSGIKNQKHEWKNLKEKRGEIKYIGKTM